MKWGSVSCFVQMPCNNSYLHDNFYAGDIRDDASLTFFLSDKINKAKSIFGMNHYKTAFCKGCMIVRNLT